MNVPLIYSDLTAPATTASGEFNGNVESGAVQSEQRNQHAEQAVGVTPGSCPGVYRCRSAILTSANYEARSGYPWARQVQFTGGRTIPNITLNVEPIGARRLPISHQLDIRFEKTFRLNKGQKLAVRANIFNILNLNTVLDVTRLSGPNFGRPSSIMDARLTEIGFTYSF